MLDRWINQLPQTEGTARRHALILAQAEEGLCWAEELWEWHCLSEILKIECENTCVGKEATEPPSVSAVLCMCPRRWECRAEGAHGRQTGTQAIAGLEAAPQHFHCCCRFFCEEHGVLWIAGFKLMFTWGICKLQQFFQTEDTRVQLLSKLLFKEYAS